MLAVEESQQSQQIADFLTGVFTSAKPRSDKNELTARDLLNQGFIDIKNKLQDNPEQRFELISVMLDSLESLSYFDTIFEYVDELHPECVAALSAQNDHCQLLLITGGEAAIGIQQDQRALTYLQLAEENARIEPINQALLVEVLRIQFNAYINLGQFEQANRTTHEALEYYQNINYSPVDIINIKSDLAVLATHQENFEVAKKHYDAMQLIINEDDSLDLEVKNLFYANYSFFFAKQKLFDQAIIQRQQAVKLMQEAYDRPSFSLAWEQESLAKLYFFAGQLEAGITAAKNAIKTFESLDSEADKHVYELKLFLAEMSVISGDWTSAHELFMALEKKSWDRRCVYELVEVLIKVYGVQQTTAETFLEPYKQCYTSVSFPTKFAEEFYLLLNAEIYFNQNDAQSSQQYLNKLNEFWLEHPQESLPLQPKAFALSEKINNL
jgi:tetratricopeptide (TPR) repeat protein